MSVLVRLQSWAHAMTKEIYRKSCGVVPVYRDGKDFFFLLVHQNNGHWAFPKGGIEDGESEVETALRELKEETGIILSSLPADSRIFEEYTIEEKEYGLATKQVVYFVGLVGSKDVIVQKEEIQGFKWLSFEEALGQLTYDGTREVLKKANVYLENKV